MTIDEVTRLRSALADAEKALANEKQRHESLAAYWLSEKTKDTAALAVERTRRKGVEEALRGLADAVADEANATHSISGRIGARLTDARAALSPAEGQPPEGG